MDNCQEPGNLDAAPLEEIKDAFDSAEPKVASRALNMLQDQELLQDPDLVDSLDQMRRGEGKVVRPRPPAPQP